MHGRPVATLERCLEAAAASPGVRLPDLDPLTMLLVQTRNTVYRLIVLQGCTVLVQGGRFFPEPTQVRLAGATFGGSMLKLGWLALGMCMEICADEGPIVTTPVRRIEVGRSCTSRPA